MGLDRSEVSKLVGQESGVIRALDDVSKSDIRHWCELIGDPDPSYEEALVRGEKTAPPAMLLTWAQDPLWPPKEEAREPHERLFELLAEAGYDTPLGLELDQEFHRRVGLGERLSYKVKVVDVSPDEEETKLGRGYRVDLLYTFLNREGEVVSTQNCKVLAFQRLTPQG